MQPRGAAAYRRASFPHLPCKQHKVSMRMDLAPGIWDRMDRKARNQVRKAQKSGLTVERGGAGLVARLLRGVCAQHARPRHAGLFPAIVRRGPARLSRSHLHPRRATERRAGRSRAHLSNGEDGAAAVGLVDPRLQSSLPESPLYWDAIEFAAEQGCAVLDLGRSTPGEGTFKFKEQWGARAVAAALGISIAQCRSSCRM